MEIYTIAFQILVKSPKEEHAQEAYLKKHFIDETIPEEYAAITPFLVDMNQRLGGMFLAHARALPVMAFPGRFKRTLIPTEAFSARVKELTEVEIFKGGVRFLPGPEPKAEPAKEEERIKDLPEFIKAANSSGAAEKEQNVLRALRHLEYLKRSAWEFKEGFPTRPKIHMVCSTREDLLKMFAFKDYLVRRTALAYLNELLAGDPVSRETANDLIELLTATTDNIKAKESQKYDITIQRDLFKLVACICECNLTHYGAKLVNAITEQTKQEAWTGSDELSSLNRDDQETQFWGEYARQAIQHMKTNEEEWESALRRIACIVLGTVSVAGIYDNYSEADVQLKKAYEYFKEAISHIEYYNKSFESLFAIRKLCRFAMNDIEKFRLIVKSIQTIKNQFVYGKDTKDSSKMDSKILFGIYGIICTLEDCVILSHTKAVQIECVKLLIQLHSMDLPVIRTRAMQALHNIAGAHVAMTPTVKVVISILMACNKSRARNIGDLKTSTSEMILSPASSASYPHLMATIRKGIEDPISMPVLKFLLRSIGQIKDQKENDDEGGQSLTTLWALTEQYEIASEIFKIISNLPAEYSGRDARGNTAFHVAARRGAERMVEIISSNTRTGINDQNMDGESALHVAVTAQHHDVVLAILKCKPNLDLQDNQLMTALRRSVDHRDARITQKLLDAKADPDIVDGEGTGQTALDVVINAENTYLIELFLASEARIAGHTQKQTPIAVAASNTKEKSLMYLIDRQLKDNQNLTPLECHKILRMISRDGKNITCSPEFCQYHLKKLKESRLYQEAFKPFSEWPHIEYKKEPDVVLVIPKATSSHSFCQVFDPYCSANSLIRLARHPDQIGEFKTFLESCHTPEELNGNHYLGLTPAHVAVYSGNTEALKALIAKKVDLNKQDFRGFTPLHFAAFLRDPAMVKLLLAAGADAAIKNDHGETPFLMLCKKQTAKSPESVELLPAREVGLEDNRELAKQLLSHSDPKAVDIFGNNGLHLALPSNLPNITALLMNDYRDLFWMKNKQGQFPIEKIIPNTVGFDVIGFLGKFDLRNLIELHEGFTLHIRNQLTLTGLLVRAEAVNILEKVIRERPDLAFHADSPNGTRPLHFAARHNYTKVLILYHSLGYSLDSPDLFGNTPAHYAAYAGHQDFLEGLIRLKVSCTTPNKDGRTPLHYAAARGHAGVAKFLMSNGVSPHDRDIHGDNPFHLAAKKECYHAMEVIYEHDHSVLDTTNDYGHAALHITCINGYSEGAQFLLGKGARFDTPNSTGATPLILTAQQGNLGILMNLLKRKPIVTHQDENGESALNHAVYHLHTKVVEALLHHARTLQLESTLVRQTDNQREIPANELVNREVTNIGMASASAAIFNQLLAAGTDVAHVDLTGQTLMHKFCSHGRKDLLDCFVSYLKEHAKKTMDARKRTLIHSALLCPNDQHRFDTLAFLLKLNKISVNAKDANEQTALHYCAFLGLKREADLLLANKADKADIEATDKDEHNVLHLLLQRDKLDSDDVLLLKELIAAKPALLLKKDNKGNTPLHILAMKGHDQALDIVLEQVPLDSSKKMEYKNALNKEGNSPFAIASTKYPDLANKIYNWVGKPHSSK
jgi:ankyrin repeat protein